MDYDENIFIIDQCAKPADFSDAYTEWAWEGRWDCASGIADPLVLMYGA